MIEWMQKHKKYLVITIWVSTIAFIAAGMIGWGQYNFSISGDNVAKVGQVKITAQELAQEYRRLYEAYASSIPDFDAEQAKAIGLEHIALNFLINQALIRNFALDLGLRTQDSEIINEITHNEVFQNNGHFDENLYKRILQDNHYRPSEFETNIANALLMQKITALLPNTITPLELQSISAGFKLQDRLEIAILDGKHLKPQISDTQLKEFWEKNQAKYQKPAQYKIESIFVSAASQTSTPAEIQNQYAQNKSLYLNDSGELETFQAAQEKAKQDLQMQKAQAQALKEYIDLKKGNSKNTQTQSLLSTADTFSPQIMQALQQAKVNDTLKPEAYKDGYITIKLIAKQPQEPKSFAEAKSEALSELETIEKNKLLKIQAQNTLSTFKGKDIGFISPSFKGKIAGLDTKESLELIGKIFTDNQKANFAIINGKAVLYKVIDQNFKNKPEENVASLMLSTAENLKTYYLDQTLIDLLKKKYTIKRY
ncbi:hypothetical protein BKH46_01260 [Helicobacter sp. 12S02634-8]|uniref:peptidylprolyl isomerase n=1 Tax=Helicobacter sp. 12S02634-8 TaxID=1476199 RepID=UPI000BA5B452|nr:peptidylprolyl isomerase [Helicobacter sp. 12S02634-8]PAF48560.1 hypothetical protein BKH46_01260 [Helicobacter sp. 12S02634-8]